eukprot:TRINITY_DN18399_c0_g1_i2.p1 TRINITY_DN18399_c0_g1~~TRINITY_DN18399_c0_g1_i2.p1  ORF type:complete len:1879 (+),score=557.42 TRINITY_DN18399_c0_g1_i2:700-5637(+)
MAVGSNYAEVQKMLATIAAKAEEAPTSPGVRGASSSSSSADEPDTSEPADPSTVVSPQNFLGLAKAKLQQASATAALQAEIKELKHKVGSLEDERSKLQRLVRIKDDKHAQTLANVAHERVRRGNALDSVQLRVECEKLRLELDGMRRENQLLLDDLTYMTEWSSATGGGPAGRKEDVADKLERLLNETNVGQMRRSFEERMQFFRKQLDTQKKEQMGLQDERRKLAQWGDQLRRFAFRVMRHNAALEAQRMFMDDEFERREPPTEAEQRADEAEAEMEGALVQLRKACGIMNTPSSLAWLENLPGLFTRVTYAAQKSIRQVSKRHTMVLQRCPAGVHPIVRERLERLSADLMEEYADSGTSIVNSALDLIQGAIAEARQAAEAARKPTLKGRQRNKSEGPDGMVDASTSTHGKHAAQRVMQIEVHPDNDAPFSFAADPTEHDLLRGNGIRAFFPHTGLGCRVMASSALSGTPLRPHKDGSRWSSVSRTVSKKSVGGHGPKRSLRSVASAVAKTTRVSAKIKRMRAGISLMHRQRKAAAEQLSNLRRRDVPDAPPTSPARRLADSEQREFVTQMDAAASHVEKAMHTRRRAHEKVVRTLRRTRDQISALSARAAEEAGPTSPGSSAEPSPRRAEISKRLLMLERRERKAEQKEEALAAEIARLEERKEELGKQREELIRTSALPAAIAFVRRRVSIMDHDIHAAEEHCEKLQHEEDEKRTAPRRRPGSPADLAESQSNLHGPRKSTHRRSAASVSRQETTLSGGWTRDAAQSDQLTADTDGDLDDFKSDDAGSSESSEESVAPVLGMEGLDEADLADEIAAEEAREEGGQEQDGITLGVPSTDAAVLLSQLQVAREGEKSAAELLSATAAAYAPLHRGIVAVLRQMKRRVNAEAGQVPDALEGLVEDEDASSLSHELPSVMAIDLEYVQRFVDYFGADDKLVSEQVQTKMKSVARRLSVVKLKQRYEAFASAGNSQGKKMIQAMLSACSASHSAQRSHEKGIAEQRKKLQAAFRLDDAAAVSDSPPKVFGRSASPDGARATGATGGAAAGATEAAPGVGLLGLGRDDGRQPRRSASAHAGVHGASVHFVDRKSGTRVTAAPGGQCALRFVVGSTTRRTVRLTWDPASHALGLCDGAPDIHLPLDGLAKHLIRALAEHARVEAVLPDAPQRVTGTWGEAGRFEIDVRRVGPAQAAEAELAVRRKWPRVKIHVPRTGGKAEGNERVVIECDRDEVREVAEEVGHFVKSPVTVLRELTPPSPVPQHRSAPLRAPHGPMEDQMPNLPSMAPEDAARRYKIESRRVAAAERRLGQIRQEKAAVDTELEAVAFVEDRAALEARRRELLTMELVAQRDAEATAAAAQELRRATRGQPRPPPPATSGSRRQAQARAEPAPPRGKGNGHVGGWTWRDAIEQGESGSSSNPMQTDAKLRALVSMVWQHCAESLREEDRRTAVLDQPPSPPALPSSAARRSRPASRTVAWHVQRATRRAEEKLAREHQSQMRSAERQWRQRYQELRAKEADRRPAPPPTSPSIVSRTRTTLLDAGRCDAAPQPSPVGRSAAQATLSQRATQGALLPLISSGSAAALRNPLPPDRRPAQPQEPPARPVAEPRPRVGPRQSLGRGSVRTAEAPKEGLPTLVLRQRTTE